MRLTVLPKYIILVTILLQSCQTQRTSEVFLVPENYKGFFQIVYNQSKGQENEIEKKLRIYKIPSSGVLFTKCKYNSGSISYENGVDYQTFFTVDGNDNRTPLTKLDIGSFNTESTLTPIQENFSRDSIGIFIIFAGIMGDGKSELTITKYFVGTYNQLANAKDIPFKYIDSLRTLLTKNGM